MIKLNQLTKQSAYNRREMKAFRKAMGARINRRLAWAKARKMILPYTMGESMGRMV